MIRTSYTTTTTCFPILFLQLPVLVQVIKEQLRMATLLVLPCTMVEIPSGLDRI